MPAVIGQVAAATFKPVYLTAYAGGLKNRFFNDLLTLNVEGFYYNYRKYQVSQKNLVTNQNNVYTTDKAEVYGVQFDGHLKPTRHDDLGFGVSLQRARALILTTPAGTFNGYQLPFAPNATMNASWRHTFDLHNGGQIEAFADGQRSSSRWGIYTHSAGTFVSPPRTFGVRFGFNL